MLNLVYEGVEANIKHLLLRFDDYACIWINWELGQTIETCYRTAMHMKAMYKEGYAFWRFTWTKTSGIPLTSYDNIKSSLVIKKPKVLELFILKS